MKLVEKVKFNMEPKYAPLEKINITEAITGNDQIWFNQTLCRINSSVLRVGVFQEGAFPMHKHDNDDELFFVIEGSIKIETQDQIFTLNSQEGICVPKGVMHRPIVEQRSIVLMVENDSITPLGDE